MAKIIGLPKLSPTMEEGTLSKWVKAEGESIEIDELIAEVETDKATMEWRSFDKTVLLKILVEEGETLEPDAPVAIFGEKGEDITALLSDLKSGSAKPTSAPEPESHSGEGVRAAALNPTPNPGNGEARPAGGRVLASPLVRRLALERDLDLSRISGSGPHGRIIKRDLDSLGSSGARLAHPAGLAGPAGGLGAERLPPRLERLSSMRRTIARRLTESKQTVPHFYLTIDIDAAPMLASRKRINEQLKADGEKISVNDVILKATAMALRRLPEVNASFTSDGILYHQVVDVAVAVAIDEGLVTPVIRDTDKKGLRMIAAEVRDLAARARDRKLMPEEMTDGTFSVSNLGMFGIEEFSAVINPPQGAILAVGAVRQEPVVVNGKVDIGQRMRMTMSCDHRVVDGALGARWLAILKAMLEDPAMMLI